jgi:PHD/YefM family antitoxin component YafN of YafNO toxin-antitoxin module
MISYTKEEIISSTTVSRNFGDILNKLADKKLKKVAVLRNNKIEAIILPVNSFEEISELSELSEHLELATIIKERENNPSFIDFEKVLAENGLSSDEL